MFASRRRDCWRKVVFFRIEFEGNQTIGSPFRHKVQNEGENFTRRTGPTTSITGKKVAISEVRESTQSVVFCQLVRPPRVAGRASGTRWTKCRAACPYEGTRWVSTHHLVVFSTCCQEYVFSPVSLTLVVCPICGVRSSFGVAQEQRRYAACRLQR